MASLIGGFAAAGDVTPWVAPSERFLLFVAATNGGAYALDVRALGDADADGFLTDELPVTPGTLREVIPASSGNKQYRLRCTTAPSAQTAWRIIP